MNTAIVKVVRTVSRQVLTAKKNSPNVMFVAGLVGVTAAAVMACKSTLVLDSTVQEFTDKLEDIKELKHSKDYSDKDRQQDKVTVYVEFGYRLTRMYGPAIVVGGLGIACLTGAHTTLTKRNAALTAAYAGLERSYNAYRQRVAKEIGEDKERKLHYEVQKNQLEIQTSEPKSKKNKNGTDYSIYARFFDDTNSNWNPQPEYNMMFLKCQQTYLNDRLHARGHVFLNEVYDALGIERSQAGAVVGWTISDDGDNYVDFGIFDGKTDAARAFVNLAEHNILLDFNVDGVIYDKLRK